MKTAFWIVAVLIAATAIWVRVAPFDARRWHVDPADAPEQRPGAYKAQLEVPKMSPEDALALVQAIAEGSPRTKQLFGTVQEGRISFLTRSRFWGFPDVTTVSARRTDAGTELIFYARLRFGGDDMGVNRARVKSWISSLQER